MPETAIEHPFLVPRHLTCLEAIHPCQALPLQKNAAAVAGRSRPGLDLGGARLPPLGQTDTSTQTHVAGSQGRSCGTFGGTYLPGSPRNSNIFTSPSKSFVPHQWQPFEEKLREKQLEAATYLFCTFQTEPIKSVLTGDVHPFSRKMLKGYWLRGSAVLDRCTSSNALCHEFQHISSNMCQCVLFS